MIAYQDTLLEYYLGIDPEELSDHEWAEKIAMLEDIRKEESKS